MDIFQETGLILGPLSATFLIGFTTFLLLLGYSYRKQCYWKNIGIPYAKPLPLLGSLYESISKPLHDLDLDRLYKYGRIYGHYEVNRPLLSIGDPDILRQMLVKDFHVFTGRRKFDTGDRIMEKMMTLAKGEAWKRIRTIVTPTFTTGKIKRMISIFKDCSRTLVQNFMVAANKGEPIDVKSIYGAFTMDVIASSAFSTKIDSHNNPTNPFVQTARRIFNKNISWRFILFFLCPGLMKIFKIPVFSPVIRDFFVGVTLQIIEERKRTGQTKNDFLQLLLDTSKEQDNKSEQTEKEVFTENYGEEENEQMFKQNIYTKQTLTHDEIIAQCVLFFIAGYHTTAATLSYASYLLALNPDVQEKLLQELDSVLKENNGELTYEAIQGMKYLDNVISETLRLYPPALRLERMADEDYPLADTGLTIPKGMLVTIPIYAIHRDPKLYPNPEKFDPNRFSPEERAKRNPYAYMPFSLGPRNCIGLRFALMELKVCLAYLLSNFRFKKCPQTEIPLEFFKGQQLLQAKSITLAVEVRNDSIKL